MIAVIESPQDRIIRLCTYAERKVIRRLVPQVDPSRDSSVVISRIAADGEFSHASVNTALRMLEAAGMIATQSMGAKGVMIRVLDSHAWNVLAQRVGD